MPVKRRNGGRSKKNRGHTNPVNCLNCHRLVPKDKAIKRFLVKDMVDASSKRDINEALAFNYMVKMQFMQKKFKYSFFQFNMHIFKYLINKN